MKKLSILFILLFVPVMVFGQAWRDGRWMNNASIDNTKLSTTAVDGSVCLESTLQQTYQVAGDSTSGTNRGIGAWYLDGSAPAGFGVVSPVGGCFKFDSDGGSTGDDIVYLKVICPLDYEIDSGRLDLYWFHLDDNGGTTDKVVWDGTVNAVGSAEDLLGAGTALDSVATVCTAGDSAGYVSILNIEKEDITYGDAIIVKIWVDESKSTLDSGEFTYLYMAQLRWEKRDD